MKKIYWWLIVSLLAVLFGLIYIYCLPSRGEIIFFNVGQGDAALIKLENGLKVLVDCGPNEIILSKLGRALPFYETRLDYLIISHPDLDHYGGCLAVIKRYKVSHVVINGDNKSDEYGRAFFARLAEEGSKVSVIDRFTRWQAGDAFFDFLAPSLDFGELSGNDRSVVFLFTHPQVKVLFTGDLGESEENLLMERYCRVDAGCPRLKADVLKVGHHGSDTSSGEEFLEAVSPTRAIISVGSNSFGHPSARVLKRLERLGAEILRTDRESDIIMKLESL